ncbi:Uncharacterised protein [Mycobacteroides abscessus subsp. abscessus]|nr:Uncharacterised protein [Mycobacteroides abscessus subsp. abscessus]
MGNTRREFSSAFGSYTVTTAPCSWIMPATFNAGESRTSSDSGLKAAPSTATFAPSSEPPQTTFARRRMLMLSTSRRNATA